jgi:hypothetical protein
MHPTYGPIIAEAIGQSHPDTVNTVEEAMRDVRPTLDGLTRQELIVLAKRTFRALQGEKP